MTPLYDDGQSQLYHGDVLTVLRTLPSESVHTCVTSPPYFGLRDYQVEGQIGLEATPEAFIARLVEVFREVRRVLRNDGTCWCNIGDSYAGGGGFSESAPSTATSKSGKYGSRGALKAGGIKPYGDVKPKDLLMIPAQLALALRADGWWLRAPITWCKSSPMPESVEDRTTSATEMIYMFSKSQRYYYDRLAITEPSGANLRNFWVIGPDPFPNAHFATFPREIPRRAILAGTSEYGVCSVCGAAWRRVVERAPAPRVAASEIDRYGTGEHGVHRKVGGQYQKWLDAHPPQTTGWQPTCPHDAPVIPATILDPFVGSGRSLAVAKALGRRGIGIDLNAQYLRDFAVPQLQQQGLFFAAAG